MILSSLAPTIQADDDTQLRLQQSIDRNALEQQQIPSESLPPSRSDALPNMVIGGQSINVEKNAEDVGTALYLSVMHRQWQAVLLYLGVYRQLPDYEPSLALFAEGALLRQMGRLREAEQAFQQAYALQPGNQITRLELARVQFENQKNRDAEQHFQAIWQHLDQQTDSSTSAAIQRSVDGYLLALKQRRSWHGSLAIGALYDDNLNQTSETTTCLQYIPGTNHCYITQRSAERIASHGLDYEGTLSKYLPLQGHHGLAFRSLAYGRAYRDNTYYNELTWNGSAGYTYRTARDQLTLSLLYEINRLGNQSEYDSWGARAEWMHIFSPSLALRLEGDYKDMKHARHAQADSKQMTAFATLFKTLPGDWTLFGGVDVVDRLSVERYMNSYLQSGIRLGLSKSLFDGFDATLFSSFRQRRYNRYNPIFREQRQDREQNYTLLLRAPKLAFQGITPSLTLRHNRVRSNVDWLYSYDKNSISLKLERRF